MEDKINWLKVTYEETDNTKLKNLSPDARAMQKYL